MSFKKPSLAQLVTYLILVRLGACSLGLSRHQCIEESTTFEEHRVCFFYNVLLWRANLYYVADDASLSLPRVSIRFGVGFPNEMWLQPTVVAPDDARFDGSTAVELAGDTYLWSTLPENNWHHQAGEYLPTMHNTICKYLGRCHLNQTRGLHLVEMFPARDFPWAPWIDDLTTCFSDSPKIKAADSALDDTIFVIEKALVGVGPECRARLFCAADPNFSGRRPVAPHQLTSYRSRMADCLGFDDKRVARVEPKLNMLVIDRRYSSGRHFVNVGEIMEALRLRYHGIADISLHYLEGMSVGQQVALWSTADIVIHMHGAAQGSWQFLPHNAVVVHVVPFPRGVVHDTQFADKWVADFQHVTNLTYVPANNLDMAYARLRFEAIWGNPEWRALSSEDRLKIIETGDCEFLQGDVKDRCTMWWVHKNMDLVLTPQVLLPAVDAAVSDLYGKLGRQPPPLAGLVADS